MKEGAGEDPFAEDTSNETTTIVEDARDEAHGPDSEETTSTPTGDQSMQIPYKYRRDSVQTGRDRVPLFLQPETKRAERDALRALEDSFDEDLSLTDLREALVKVGLDHLDDVEGVLSEWGYGMTFDE